jgi:nucleotide-binding universal stress UspA family protein
LLIVRQEPRDKYKHVLVPVDFSKNSLNALEMALKAVMDASIHVLHAVEMPLGQKMKQAGFDAERVEHFRNQILIHAREGMEKIVSDHAHGDRRVASIIEYGHAPDVIREKAQALDIDLIVIGKRGQTELDEALFGSVTKHVLYETPCDVLVVNP